MSEICTTCGLPADLCVCESIAKESQKIEISTIRKKFGKVNTVVTGIDGKEIDVKDIGKKLKGAFACGGTSKGGVIELQGNHLQAVKKELVKLGFAPDTIEIVEAKRKKRR